MPKLSIVTCVYNAEKFIKESLDSVFDQPFKDFELIIVDDKSTDTSLDYICKYTDNSNIKIIKNTHNEGVAYSRNKAFLKAQGEYIAIHDADDVTLPWRFQKQVECLDSDKKITFMGGHAIKIGENGQEIGSMVYPPVSTEGAFRVISRFKLNPIIDPSSMFRRNPILNIGGYRMNAELRTVQDFDLWCRLLVSGHLMYNLQEPVIKYRINSCGVTRQKKQEQVEATDIVWAAFNRRSFPQVKLKPELFEQENSLNFLNKNEENKV